jgi:hypothetical protein
MAISWLECRLSRVLVGPFMRLELFAVDVESNPLVPEADFE